MRFLLLCFLCLVSGCAAASMQKRTYDVTVKNRSTKPVTIWLTKDGPAWEQGWKSPEDLAHESPTLDERIAGMIVLPGETATTGNISGSFAPSTHAILRVYQGQRKITELLAMSADDPERIDTALDPGPNAFTVIDRGPGIQLNKE